eukprot:gnl/MRDRNA2_/MRDRNA2_146369_c0_seq1.p1 gnl/MRDRNA2_/MRDRNA2_146369_c0~~gnl/MRDRNA2_/MRDRNA2_146369_c0_seq1.p1  ORF type:complete len:136 (-),score=37.36 gnl/MRDRNA2_/MRDRNA2_146369_c0_seq1:77-484(-)
MSMLPPSPRRCPGKPDFLQPAFVPEPAQAPPTEWEDSPMEESGSPSVHMAPPPQTPTMRPRTAEGKDPLRESSASELMASNGFVPAAKVESLHRLNQSLEKENENLEAEVVRLMALNEKLKSNASTMEKAIADSK